MTVGHLSTGQLLQQIRATHRACAFWVIFHAKDNRRHERGSFFFLRIIHNG